ncbi:putative F-box domain containing protein [Lyophyllum shimeji]|uniref:F-box domain containing protein n=1 Tax=Lyophyllum shimeji TaxID=47721 RepID=A0A9P3UIP8_LYOSH|nr:putative F-box domain containing protein [Lyophyllum shimeji]
MDAGHSLRILDIAPEVLLHIFSYLDLPDLAAIAQALPELAALTVDPVLHKNRVRIVAPSRVNHSLFGEGPHGIAFRPTVGDLIHRGVMRGFGIERRWRTGAYFYSLNSIIQYETGLRLARRHACDVISTQLRRRPTRDKFLDSISHVLPDVELASHMISRTLLPAIHQLKWSLQRDRLSRMVRLGIYGSTLRDGAGFGGWREKKGHGIVEDGERVRLAICPDVKKTVKFYEGLAQRPT